DPSDSAAMERAIKDFAHQSDSGLIVIQSGASIKYRGRIIVLAAQQRLPAVYSISFFVEDGGLISYGPNLIEQYRRAAGYVDPHPERTKTGRSTGASAQQIRAGD